MTAGEPPAAQPAAAAVIDGSGTVRSRCVLAPNPSAMTLDGTNTWLIAEPGSGTVVVVDPGPDDEGHLRRIHALAAAADQRIASIVLTHGHSDHSAGARRLAQLAGAPVLAVDRAHRLGSEGLRPGDVVTAGGCELRVIATPGHTADSVCLEISADGAVLTGDTVLGRGTTVIAADGNLSDYLGSLDQLRSLAEEADLRVLLPGHGPVLADPAGTLDFYLTHRAERLAEIEAAVAAGDLTAAQIVARVYAAVDPALWPFAQWSVRAQLAYLAGRGRLPPGVSW
ncbi:MAG TPA: MBL fold metallo-hydrolase [Streptosporangiaceae bacterium]|nr:MBL fold metallo-hydrolase [Streptosporangiaceae bacterium]